MDSDNKFSTPNKYNSNTSNFRVKTYENSSSGGGGGSGGRYRIFNLDSNLNKIITPRRNFVAASGSGTSLIAKQHKNALSSPFTRVINPFEAALTERLHLPLIDRLVINF